MKYQREIEKMNPEKNPAYYNGLDSKEWERIYTDGVQDAYMYGMEETRSKYIVKMREDLNTLRNENERLRQENELLKEQLKDSWRDGYDASMHDRFHGTSTKYDPTDYEGV